VLSADPSRSNRCGLERGGFAILLARRNPFWDMALSSPHSTKWTRAGGTLAAVMVGCWMHGALAAIMVGCSGSGEHGAGTDPPAGADGNPSSRSNSSSTDSASSGTTSISGDDGGSVGGIAGGIIGTGTTLAGCEIFPPDNPWNVEVDGPGVKVIHTYDAQIPQGGPVHPDFGGYTANTGGIPFNVVGAGKANLDTKFVLYASESDPGPGGWIGANPVATGGAMGETAWPFFVGMEIEGNPSPGGTPGSLPGDQHGLVLEQGASGCTAYEAWNCAVVSAAPFLCANGAVFDLTSNTSRPAGWTSADAAGLAILPGLVKLSEVVTARVVTHAIRMTFNTTQQGYIAPATHAAGSQPLGSAYPPMGLRMRMKASVSISSYTAASQVIMTAMKKYGLIVADNGSDWYPGRQQRRLERDRA
jgi:hypothetical protein